MFCGHQVKDLMSTESIKKEEWLSDGSWVCVVEAPGGMKNELISQVAQRSSEVSVKELD